MIAELRRKFIAATMGAVAVVLAIIMGGVNVANYLSMVDQVDAVLDVLCTNGGAFPEGLGFAVADGWDPSEAGADEGAVAPGADGPRPAGFEKLRAFDDGGRGRITLETPYETRYFSVDLDGGGSVVRSDLAHVASVAQDEAEEVARQLGAEGETSGFAGSYRFRAVAVDENGGVRYVFVDAGRDLDSFRSFRNASLLVSAAGLLAVLGLSVPLSGRAVQPVARAYDKQRRFVTDASHELKTPLSIIGANTDLIELEQGESEWTRSTKAQVERMGSLVRDMLYLARMDEGGMHLAMEDVALSDAVSRTVATWDPVARERGVSLTRDVALNVRCRGDRAALEEVVSILLDNALKYCGEHGRVEVRLEREGKKARLTVWNTAEGLPQGQLDMLFERFYRQDTSRNSQTGGHGVGLSIAQAVVEAHKGRIWARSDDGASMTCVVVL